MKIKYFVVFLLFVNFFVNAQEKYTISGVVSDINSGETLLGATVYISGTSIGAVTNQYGFYSITTEAGNKIDMIIIKIITVPSNDFLLILKCRKYIKKNTGNKNNASVRTSIAKDNIPNEIQCR